MRIRQKCAVQFVLVAVFALLFTACAAKVRIGAPKMCQAHGGTYDASAQSCTYTSSTKSAKESCEAQGGWYDPGPQECMIMQ